MLWFDTAIYPPSEGLTRPKSPKPERGAEWTSLLGHSHRARVYKREPVERLLSPSKGLDYLRLA